MDTENRQLSFFDLYKDGTVGEGVKKPTLGALLKILEEGRLVASDYDRHMPNKETLESFVARYRGVEIKNNRNLKYELTMARCILKFLKDAPMRIKSLKREAEDMQLQLERLE